MTTAARKYISRDPRSSDYEPLSADDLPKAPHNTLPDEESARRVRSARERKADRLRAQAEAFANPSTLYTIDAIDPETAVIASPIREGFTRADIDWDEISRVSSHDTMHAYIEKHGIPQSRMSERIAIAMAAVWARKAEQLRNERGDK